MNPSSSLICTSRYLSSPQSLLLAYVMISSSNSGISVIHLSYLEMSHIKQNTLALSTWRKNALPSPFHSAAPLINHGISMTLKFVFCAVTDHKFGTNVVNG